MADYGVIHAEFWTDPDHRDWSQDAFTVAAYLLTCGHKNQIGCFYLPFGYIAADLHFLPSDRLRLALALLNVRGFIAYDEATGWVWIRRFLKWNSFQSGKVASAALKQAQKVPRQCRFYEDFCNDIKRLGKWSWGKDGDFADRLPVAYPLPNVSLELAKPYPDPDPDPKESSDIGVRGGGAGGGVPAVQPEPAAPPEPPAPAPAATPAGAPPGERIAPIAAGPTAGRGTKTPRAASSDPKAARRCRLPEDWAPSVALIAWAAAEGITAALDLTEATERFRDYWRGAGKPMADWDATWRNWMRRERKEIKPKTVIHLHEHKKFQQPKETNKIVC